MGIFILTYINVANSIEVECFIIIHKSLNIIKSNSDLKLFRISYTSSEQIYTFIYIKL